jgi:hypothetical protein
MGETFSRHSLDTLAKSLKKIEKDHFTFWRRREGASF